MSVTQVYIFRHGETDWNKNRRFQGHTDIALNEIGIKQAESLIPHLKFLSPEVILCSDLVRAKLTAEIANTHLQSPILFSPHLRECHLGDSEGMYLDQVLQAYGSELLEKWQSTSAKHQHFGFPNGETKSQHLKRLIDYIESYMNANAQIQTVAISTHGGSLRRLIHHCIGSPSEPIPIPNCSLYHATYDRLEKKWFYVGKIN